jgi:uncharacterized protein (DUF849 family)
MLQVALNGGRSRSEHPRVPRTPEELAADCRACVAAGARVLHLHAYDGERETFAAEPSAAALRAVRAACPGIPISLSTSAAIEPDPERRLALITGWTELPELVTANQGEAGIAPLCEHLLARGVGIEAGLLAASDVEPFLRSGLPARCVRVLLEPLDAEPDAAVAHAAAMEARLAAGGVALPQVHHGEGVASWSVSVRALARGHGIRTGLEDTTALPTGEPAADNEELVRIAAALLG